MGTASPNPLPISETETALAEYVAKHGTRPGGVPSWRKMFKDAVRDMPAMPAIVDEENVISISEMHERASFVAKARRRLRRRFHLTVTS